MLHLLVLWPALDASWVNVWGSLQLILSATSSSAVLFLYGGGMQPYGDDASQLLPLLWMGSVNLLILSRVYMCKVCVVCVCFVLVLLYSGMLRLYKIFQQAVPPVSDLRLMCHLLNNCSLYMSTILIYLLSINIGNN